MEEQNRYIDKSIKNIQNRNRILKNLNILFLIIIVTISVVILIHKVYLKENTYSIITNTVINSVDNITIENKDTELIEGKTLYYLVFSNDKMKNKIYVNEGVYNECIIGQESTVRIKDIYDKKGNILKEELLFDIIN